MVNATCCGCAQYKKIADLSLICPWRDPASHRSTCCVYIAVCVKLQSIPPRIFKEILSVANQWVVVFLVTQNEIPFVIDATSLGRPAVKRLFFEFHRTVTGLADVDPGIPVLGVNFRIIQAIVAAPALFSHE